ncbi:hypothetical protein B0T18DRAFT_408232 [Schizothecium vesticola]|uniref:Uncharacterized protein n=1 Tax=Schizothecium vesticola TaxID=314040 RepID=A0AA40K8X6_9PEZI|nr:hypothetical protein B0T18DRAFT_408232 [Schizothecium vesticola]
MVNLKRQIQQAATKHEELIRILAETDHAAPSLNKQKTLIANLEIDIAASDARVAAEEVRRLTELKDHEQYRDSIVRRLAYRATGKREAFEAQAHKEETEYFETLQREHREKETNKALKARLAAAQLAAQALEIQVAHHNEIQQELDQLFEAIFGGRTPGFPEEDERERLLELAVEAHKKASGRVEDESTAVRLLSDAQEHFRSSKIAMKEALSASNRHFFFNGVIADMIEHSALFRAQMEAMSARNLVLDAQFRSSLVETLPDVVISQDSAVKGNPFSSWVTDTVFQEEIKASAARVEQASAVLDGFMIEAAARLVAVKADFARRERELRDAWCALHKARETAFESLARRPLNASGKEI